MKLTLKAGDTLHPPKVGLKHEWRPGEVAILNCHAKVHCVVLGSHIRRNRVRVECLDSDGEVNSHDAQDLLTAEGWLKLCDYMRDGWIGSVYSEMRERAKDGMPFVVPDWFPAALERAMEPISEKV